MIPYASVYVASMWRTSGLAYGLFVGSYSLGRALGTPLWLCFSHFCGSRPVLQICLLLQFFLTLCFGLCSSFQLALLFRLGVGFFAPGYALARPLLCGVLARDREHLPASSVAAAGFFALMQTAGLVLGTAMVGSEDLPYLEASLVEVILLLFAFVVVSTDFPTINAADFSIKSEQKEPKPKSALPQNGKFAEFTSEEPQEERKEEEEVPSYLQSFASPNFPKLQVLKGLFTEEAEDPQSLTLDSQIRESEGQPEPNVKRTHISFVEEELKEVESKSGPVEDPFRVEGKVERLKSGGYCWSVAGYAGTVGFGTAVEYASIYWLAGEMYYKRLGVLLSCVYGGAAVLQFFLMSKCVDSLPLNSLAVWTSLIAALCSSAIPYSLSLCSNALLSSFLLVALLLLRDLCFRLLCTTLVLRISDKVTTSLRPRALATADALGAFAKAGGVLIGPGALVGTGLLSLSLPTGLAVGAGIGFTLVTAVMVGTGRHYQRFYTAPYHM